MTTVATETPLAFRVHDDDDVEAGVQAIGELVDRLASDKRDAVSASTLVLGHECGGSDGFSGLSANPLLGRLADRITSFGGTVVLTEVPEMFGAEQLLLDRTVSDAVFDDVTTMIDDFKAYFVRHDQPVYENPSPGNKAGGLTTLEEKSLGTPLGFPVPTLKLSSNSDIAARKPRWIDFDAGRVLTGEKSMNALTDDLLALVLDVASGRTLARNEEHGYREIAIWKHGVTL